jgi:hypothetical protein
MNAAFNERVNAARAAIADGSMTWEAWCRLSPEQREAARDNSGLHPRLIGLEGARVECMRYGERVRFQVGRSTGWRPCHLDLFNARSSGGSPINGADDLGELRVIRYARTSR